MILRVKGDLGVHIGSKMRNITKAVNSAAQEASEQLAEMVVNNISRGFADLPWGDERWKWLSEKYAKSIGAESPSDHPGLVDTTALINSVKTVQHADGKFEVIVNDWKAEIHEYGMDNMPKRPFFRPAYLAFRESGMAKDILNEHLDGVFNE